MFSMALNAMAACLTCLRGAASLSFVILCLIQAGRMDSRVVLQRLTRCLMVSLSTCTPVTRRLLPSLVHRWTRLKYTRRLRTGTYLGILRMAVTLIMIFTLHWMSPLLLSSTTTVPRQSMKRLVWTFLRKGNSRVIAVFYVLGRKFFTHTPRTPVVLRCLGDRIISFI